MLLYLIIIAISLIASTYFFSRGAGTLHIGRLNLISVVFYLFLVQVFLGAALIMLGMDEHYTLTKLINHDTSVSIMFYTVMATAVLWPACMYGFLRVYKINPKLNFNEYLKKPTITSNSKMMFWVALSLGLVGMGLLAAYIKEIGYIPFLKLVNQPDNFNFSAERIRINGTLLYNVYIRNILILLAIPVMSYISFAFALATRSKKWIALTILLIAASIITKTYNFEKAPIIFHFAVYVMILIYFKGGIKIKWMIPTLGFGAVVLSLAYILLNNTVTLDLYNGLFGRLLFSQVGALTFNFDLFPNTIPFLEGRSISATILSLLGADPELHIRSARIVMEFYMSDSVYDGIAGVMNSFYIGEAYANFGWLGSAFSVVWTAFIISGLFALTLKIRKTPVTVVLAAYVSVNVALTINGGFMDFLYNISWAFVIGGLLILEYFQDITKFVMKRYQSRSS